MKAWLPAVLLVLAAIAGVLWLHGPRSALHSSAPVQPATRLSDSLAPLAEAFNAESARPRLLTALSPSCPVCLNGAEAVETELLASRPELVILLVWTDVLPWDSVQKRHKRVRRFAAEPAIRQFSDPRRLASLALGARLGWPEGEPAWDVYLFYPPGVRWEGELPLPAAWFHQQPALFPEHFRTGIELGRAFREVAPTLTARHPDAG